MQNTNEIGKLSIFPTCFSVNYKTFFKLLKSLSAVAPFQCPAGVIH